MPNRPWCMALALSTSLIAVEIAAPHVPGGFFVVTQARAESLSDVGGLSDMTGSTGSTSLVTKPAAAIGARSLPRDSIGVMPDVNAAEPLAMPSTYSRNGREELPDSGRARPYGVYAPYLASPPLGGDGSLDPKSLLNSLEARGFTDLSRPVLRGRTYICEATGPRRERVRLVVDAESGVIVGLTVLGYDSRSSSTE